MSVLSGLGLGLGFGLGLGLSLQLNNNELLVINALAARRSTV